MSDNLLGLYIIFAVMLIPVLIALWVGRDARKTVEDFFLQSRRMGGAVTFFTVGATWWSSYAFLGSIGYFYGRGPLYWSALAWNIFFGVLFYFIGRKIWYLGKRNGYMTAADFVRHQYGSSSFANLITGIMIVGTIPYLQIQLMGAANLIQLASGGEIPYAIGSFAFYIIIVVCIWIGGQRAVAWSDVFFGVLLFSGMVAGGVLAVDTVGGAASMFHQLEEINPQHLVLAKGASVAWISMFLITPIGSFMAPQTWSAIYAVKKARTFAFMPFLLAFLAIAYMGTMLTGNTGRLLYTDVSQVYFDNLDYILPTILFKSCSFVVAAIIMACGTAAAFSTANSQVIALATVWTRDIYKRYVDRDSSEQQQIWVGRVAALGFLAIAYIMSLYVPVALIAFGNATLGFTAQVMVPVCGAIFWRCSTLAGAVSGVLVGCACNALFGWTGISAPWIFAAGGSGLFALLSNLVVFGAVSLMTKPREKALMKELEGQYAEYYRESGEY